ncbi:single-stranded DNA-binding protein [Fusobacterium necrophorum subsp. funduliforme]|uniref:Single-stranded DNA-binding protein n=4 Tax=Fusobacterium necrophorum TaxID=859 RepID=A0A4Q2L301_9FUSO|nr:single-stranded DNA-binding protein [Fusobacterium necrophorum]EHO19266.1 single-strand binding protein [Fusobacterium necrophorum subsp. funduliforme 1_1_36S]AVQ21680.1 single-stranded DNA-binding protein [Fusobacterium necrophorum subsp. funduliforme]AYV93167.1 single-stranded DNA-binding protein [Fusobacterium necrophorum subsp. funduliforme]AYV95299.1 single-stranded DNA-binding protein [Fusobacterium necrophorum subsp. funduliforme]EFS23822.1 single-strand binding family protein [Fusob
MNVISLMGRLTRDPEVKFGQSGKAYCRFSIAVNRPFSKDEADFINCVSFGKTAELIGEYFRKGQQIALVGRLQMNQYESNGEKRTSYDVVVDTFDFIGTKSSSDTRSYDSPYEPRTYEARSPETKPAAASKRDSFEDNLDSEAMLDDEFPF